MIKGFATYEGTMRYLIRNGFCSDQIRKTKWFCLLPIALGNHLGDFSDTDSEKYVDAMIYGVNNGINYLDTAINYRGMRSEKDTGKVIKQLIKENKVSRDEMILSTKCGLIFGDILAGIRPQEYLEKILSPQGIVKNEEFNKIDGYDWHTLSPHFYKFATDISHKNLGIQTIDIHYLHIPEISKYVLGEYEFYKQLKILFEFYESQVKSGSLRFYGIASEYGLTPDVKSDWFLSLEKIVEIAKEVAGIEHHFKFIQIPYNKNFTDAGCVRNQKVAGNYYTVLEAAEKLELVALANMPLQMGGFEKDTSVEEMMKFVTDTQGITAAIVGSKNKEHILENINMYK